MHSCVNWTATNPLCTKSREMNPTVHQFSVSTKTTHNNKRRSKTHTAGWLISNKETLCHMKHVTYKLLYNTAVP